MDYGKQYKYAHDFDNNFVNIEFLPKTLEGESFYKPSNNPAEEAIRNRMRTFWKDKYGY
jgi:putative ATPase